MTQKERLIELLQNIPMANVVFGGKSVGRKVAIASHIADYLLENGVIVLPCKAGDKVYFLDSIYKRQGCKMVRTDYVATGEVDNIAVGGAGVPHITVFYHDNEWVEMFDAGDFGNIAFLTKEEAEKALAERGNNEN